MRSVVLLNVIMQNVVAPFIFFEKWNMHYEPYAECRITLFVTQSVIMLNVIMLHVVAPFIFFDEWSMHYEPYAECHTTVMLHEVSLS